VVRLSAIQLNSTPNVEENLSNISRLISELPHAANHLVVLPECCLFFGGSDRDMLELAKATAEDNRLANALAMLAKEHQVTLVAGSIPVAVKGKYQFTNRCCVFSPEGKLVSQYDKIHLFDVEVADKSKSYKESKYTLAGEQVVLADTSITKIGLAICYDLRFPGLFGQLRQQGANVVTLPSAFTRVTGEAHWQPLIQARAIENQVYMVAAGQVGIHQNGRETWGHSMIVDPWGRILAERADEVGSISVEYQSSVVEEIREKMPVLAHNQFLSELNI